MKSQPKSCSHYHSVREQFRKNIRRQYIQEFQKRKRRQWTQDGFEGNSNQGIGNLSPEEQKEKSNYIGIMERLTLQSFQENPNSYLQVFKEIVHSLVFSHMLRNWKMKMMYILYQALEVRLLWARKQKTSIIDAYKNAKLKPSEHVYVENPILESLLQFNLIFFDPLAISQEQAIKYTDSGSKISIRLMMEFLMGLFYDLAEDDFSNPQIMSKIPVNNSAFTANGYDSYLNPPQSEQQSSSSFMLNLFEFMMRLVSQLFEVGVHVRYQENFFKKILQFQFDLSHINVEKTNHSQLLSEGNKAKTIEAFISSDTSMWIYGNCLIIFMNITGGFQSDSSIMELFLDLNVLESFNSVANDLPLSDLAIEVMSSIYAHSIDSLLMRYEGQSMQNTRLRDGGQKTQVDVETEGIMTEKEEQYFYSFSQGIYFNLLSRFCQMGPSDQGHTILQNSCFILTKILGFYEITSPQKMKFITIESKQQNNQSKDSNKYLILNEYQCESLADAIHAFIVQIDKMDNNEKTHCIQYIGELFLLLCTKFLPYMIRIHQLVYLLNQAVKNFNLRIEQLKQKRTKRNSLYDNTERPDTFQDKNHKDSIQVQIKCEKQKIRKIILGCIGIIESLNQNERKEIIMTNMNEISNVSEDVIKGVIQLWKQNQLEYCCTEMNYFIRSTVFCLGEKIAKQKKWQEQVIFLLEDFDLDKSLKDRLIYIEVLELILGNVETVLNKGTQVTSKGKADTISNMKSLLSEWEKILQSVEGELYRDWGKQSKETVRRLEKVYTRLDFILKTYCSGKFTEEDDANHDNDCEEEFDLDEE